MKAFFMNYWPLMAGAVIIAAVIYGMVRLFRNLMKK